MDPSLKSRDSAATVRRMFDAFRRGDLDALVETIYAESRWTYFDANRKPAKTELVGRARVREFFDTMINRAEITAFNANEFIVQGETVVVFGSESWTAKASGERFHNEWAQKYVVKNDLITSMVEFNIQVVRRR